MKTKIEFWIKNNKIIQSVYRILFSSFFKFLSLFIKIDKKMVLFNGHGKRFNDSPKAIFEYMLRDSFFDDFKFFWAVDKPEKYTIPKATIIKQDSLKYFLVSLKSKFWISCVNIERGLNFKKKETIYLNTWHGIPLKFVGNKVKNRKDFNFSYIDIFCASGIYDAQIYIDDFNVSKNNILMSGLPRNDELYLASEFDIEYAKEKLDIPKKKKIILYAPTWRDSGEKSVRTTITPPLSLSLWKAELENDFIILFRAHAYTVRYFGIEFDSFIRDYSNYDNLNELMLISDILISDYSATIIDYSILKKPIFCFGYDYDKYLNERGLYVDLRTIMPYGVIQDEVNLIKNLKKINEYDISLVDDLNAFFIKVGFGATKKCIDELKKRSEKK